MPALTISLGKAAHFLFRRRFGDPVWDAIVRASGALALIAILVTLYEPHAAALTGLGAQRSVHSQYRRSQSVLLFPQT